MKKVFDLVKGVAAVGLVGMIIATVWTMTTGAISQAWIITGWSLVCVLIGVFYVASEWEMREQDEQKRRFADK